jgi:hypothetical protein
MQIGRLHSGTTLKNVEKMTAGYGGAENPEMDTGCSQFADMLAYRLTGLASLSLMESSQEPAMFATGATLRCAATPGISF